MRALPLCTMFVIYANHKYLLHHMLLEFVQTMKQNRRCIQTLVEGRQLSTLMVLATSVFILQYVFPLIIHLESNSDLDSDSHSDVCEVPGIRTMVSENNYSS